MIYLSLPFMNNLNPSHEIDKICLSLPVPGFDINEMNKMPNSLHYFGY